MAGEYADRVQGPAGGGGGDPINVIVAGTASTNIAQWGGVATSLGQKVMASSVPVVIASNQSAIPVSQSGAWSVSLTGTGSINLAQYGGVAVGAGNALHVQPGTAAVFPVNDNAGSLTVDTPQLPAALVGGRLDVNVGNVPTVDTELPAAAALADNVGNPTTPMIGAAAMGWNAGAGNWRRMLIDSETDALATSAAGNVPHNIAVAYGINGAGNLDRMRVAADNSDAMAVITLGVLRTLAEGMLFDGTNWLRARGNATSGARVSLERTTLIQAGNPAANTALTLTLAAAGAGLFHYITHLYIARVATAALAGGAILEITTTNLNGLRWATGNQASITVSTFDGGVVTDADYAHPIKSAVANTASTIVMPAPGAAVSWRAWVAYYTGP